MSLIKKAVELQVVNTMNMMIFGMPGMGKTTLALSMPRPLLLDFDNGVKRVNPLHKQEAGIVEVNDWNEIHELVNEDLSDYDTVVVDTAGKMINFIITYKCGQRQPQIRDWQGINAEFNWFVSMLNRLNKNVVFVAHADSRKENDNDYYFPLLRDKNYKELLTDFDLLGFAEMKSIAGVITRTITFDPTNRNDGKNTCQLPSVINIPEILDRNGASIRDNDFLTKNVLIPFQNMKAHELGLQKEYSELLDTIKKDIALIKDADSANKFVAGIKTNYNHIGSSVTTARVLLQTRVAELGLTWDKTKKLYVDKTKKAKKVDE